MNKMTDMAIEFASALRKVKNGRVVRTDVVLDNDDAQKLGKAPGKYVTVESDVVKKGERTEYSRLADALADVLREMSCAKKVLVVGLGNPKLTADSLGNRVFDRLITTRQLGAKNSLAALCPNVMGVTGIESFDVIKGVCERVKPTLVLAVDSLASANTQRIASAFQLCSSGITPGSGVRNHKLRLNEQSLGCQVVSLGVPLVVYASTIVEEAVGKAEVDDSLCSLIVTPKDIDFLVDECADIIAAAINRTFGLRI